MSETHDITFEAHIEPHRPDTCRLVASRPIYEGVLDMLAGRYPSDEFAELKPRVTWDRVANALTARQGARHIAVVNGGTYGSEPHLPFGGLRQSGTGWREAGTQALDVYSDLKTVYINHDPNHV